MREEDANILLHLLPNWGSESLLANLGLQVECVIHLLLKVTSQWVI